MDTDSGQGEGAGAHARKATFRALCGINVRQDEPKQPGHLKRAARALSCSNLPRVPLFQC